MPLTKSQRYSISVASWLSFNNKNRENNRNVIKFAPSPFTEQPFSQTENENKARAHDTLQACFTRHGMCSADCADGYRINHSRLPARS